MNRIASILSILAAASTAAAGDPFEVELDPVGDTSVRRTDPGADGALNPNQVLPDLRSITVSKWMLTPTTTGEIFTGTATNDGDHLFRIDLVFQGLVNPPGPLTDPSDVLGPFVYGPNPLYGFIEINIDRRNGSGGRDTGGDRTAEAFNHYLANVARFGGLPGQSLGARVITHAGEADFDFQTIPQFERSGAEFVLKLCGCDDFNIIDTSVPGDTVFTAGDEWVIRGQFFERTSGFRNISLMACPTPQVYAPQVNLRFAHNVQTDLTQVSLVYAIDQEGARQMAGLNSLPPLNDQVGCDGDQGSIAEAMNDVMRGVDAAVRSNWFGIDLPTRILSQGWANRLGATPLFLDPTDWRVTAIVGTTYARSPVLPPNDGAEFVWTDVSACQTGDLTGDSVINHLDRSAISSSIVAQDGGGNDADGEVNNRIAIPNFGTDFDIADLNYDGFVDCHDLGQISSGPNPCCRADWNGDGALTLQDLFAFLADWFSGYGDYNVDSVSGLQDLFDYLAQYFRGC